MATLVLCVLALAASSLAAKLPDYVPVCKRSLPNIDECLRNSLETVRPHFAKGIPKMKIPALEPLIIPALEINRNTEALQVKAKIKDLRAFGGSNFIVNSLKTDLDKLALDVSITIPFLRVTADYDMDGRILVIPLKGKGIFYGNLTNSRADIKATGKMIKNKKGVQFAQVKTINVRLGVGDQSVRFVNKGGRETEAITQTAMNFYNQNRKQVLEIVMPIVEETAVAFAREFANAILRSVPFAELFPN